MRPADDERLRRWRLVLGQPAAEPTDAPLTEADLGMDRVLEALYDTERKGGLGPSSPNVARWLGDIRGYFPASVVRVMQQDALDRLGLRQMLLEPELLAAAEPDIHLVASLLALGRVIPQRTKETARMVVRQRPPGRAQERPHAQHRQRVQVYRRAEQRDVLRLDVWERDALGRPQLREVVVRRVVQELERRLAQPTRQAVTGSLSRATRSRRPRVAEIDWDRTIRANLRHYDRDRRTVVAERLVGRGRRRSALRDIVLCVDQSGSMAASLVYSSVFAAVLASLRAVTTRMIVFDTAVADLTDQLHDPVDLLFGTQLGGGTDINRALAYCQQVITRPAQTILVLITDLFEGGDAAELLKRTAAIVQSGTTVICLLALNDHGAPAFESKHAAAFAGIGVPTFACTPDLFPDLMAAAIQKRDIGLWAARHEIVAARPAAS